jgi:pimeloyl-ACP methyl ester carboxylesterase
MSEKPLHELSPFTSQQARDRYLDHYAAREKFWPIASENRTVKTGHGTTFLRVSGPVDAPPLVLLPGGQSTSLVWSRVIEPLSARFRTFALDSIFDQGRSVPARPMKDVTDLTAWLDGVLDALGLTDGVNMAGMSYGAYATAEYALHAPQRLRKIVWVAPVMIAAPISQEFLARLSPCAGGGREPLEAFCRWVMPSLAALGGREIDDRMDEILLVRETYGTMIPPVRGPVLPEEDLARIAVPALYILGERDGATDNPREVLAHVAAVVPGIETMLVPEAGHDVVVAQPRLVADRMIEFLERSDSSGERSLR